MLDQFLQEISKSYDILKRGGVILYPTDTVCGIGCNPLYIKALQKLYKIKCRDPKKALILLVSSYQMLKRIVKVPKQAWQLMEEFSHPLTIVYDNPIGIFSALSADDGTLAVRITKNLFCRELINTFGGPLTSTSANLSGDPTPLSYSQISSDILEAVDYIVDLPQKDQLIPTSGLSTIIRCYEDKPWEILRK